jgi:large subunit ribosomal protein L14
MMIQKETRLKVADNSGVQEIGCIDIIGRGACRFAGLGDEIVASTKRVTPDSPIAKGIVVRAVIVRCKAPTARGDGTYISFDENAAVIVDDQQDPRATRVFGPVARELRERGFMRIISLAPEVV